MRPLLQLKNIHTIAFSPKGDRVATLSPRQVAVWSPVTKKKHWGAHVISHPSDVAFSPNGKRLAVKSTSGQIVLVDAQTGDVEVDFDNQADGAGCNVCFSPTGRQLLNGTWRGCLQVHSLKSGKVVEQIRFYDEHSMVNQIEVDYKTSTIAVRHENVGDQPNESISIWPGTVKQGKENTNFIPEILIASFALLGKTSLLIAHENKISEMKSGKYKELFSRRDNMHFRDMAYSKKSRVACLVTFDDAQLFCLRSKRIHTLDTGPYPENPVFSSDGKLLAVTDVDFGYVMETPSNWLKE